MEKAYRRGIAWAYQGGQEQVSTKALSQGDVEDDNKDNDKVLKLWTLNYHQQMCFTKFSPIFVCHFGRVDSRRKVFSSKLC